MANSFTARELELNRPALDYARAQVVPFIENSFPLRDSLGIGYVSAMRWFEGRSHFFLATDTDFLDSKYTNYTEIGPLFQGEFLKVPDEGYHYYMWDFSQYNRSHAIHHLHERGFKQACTIFKRHGDHIEAYGFASTYDGCSLANVILNDAPLIHAFIAHLKQKSPFINNFEDKRLHWRFKKPVKITPGPDAASGERGRHFLKAISAHVAATTADGRAVKLSPREEECLRLMASGHSARQTGLKLGLSQRTVEFYINTMKKKTGNRSRHELFDFFHKNRSHFL